MLLLAPGALAELFGVAEDVLDPGAGDEADVAGEDTGAGDGELPGAAAVETLMLTFCPAAQWPETAQM